MNKRAIILIGSLTIGVLSIMALACPCPPCPPCYHVTGSYPNCGCGWNCGSGSCCNGSCCNGLCCNNVCCDTGENCCNGECCNGTCCNGVCCPEGRECCEGICCDAGDTCIEGVCCSAEQSCNGTCCPEGQECCYNMCCDSSPTSNGCGPGGDDGISDDPANCSPPDDSSFADACAGHDECYGECGNSKSYCDETFSDAMHEACLGNSPLCYISCEIQRSLYGTAVWAFGGDNYTAAQMCACCVANP